MCSTKALLAGDGDVLSEIYRQRVTIRQKGTELWGWSTAYGRPDAKGPGAIPPPAPAPTGGKS
jgi:formate dehydrogenase iron-sulfur subunit